MMSPIPPAPIYLASRSPRRRELLTQIGVHYELLLFRGGNRQDPEILETALRHERPEDYVIRVARAKAGHGVRLCGLRGLASRPVLSADTTLDVDGVIVGKPADEAEASAILKHLSGREHRVLTAVAVAHGDIIEHALSISEVRFRVLGDDEIRRYVRSGEPLDKAGAYGIQGRAAIFVESIAGSHSGIVGLPLCETALLLRQFGYPV
jgi:septum formation protein